ncbi:MAG: class sortase [Nocardioides sp.]|nr:class sortase [Nocardioides sp.]
MATTLSEPVVGEATATEPPVKPRRKAVRRRRETAPPRPPHPKSGSRDWDTATLVAGGLTVLAMLVVAFGGFLFGATKLQANRTQDVLFDEIKVSLAQATVPVGGVIASGTPLGIVEIPDLGVEQVFVAGSASEQTIGGPGLRHDSVLPGQAGVSVLVGRRSSYGAPFAHLGDLRTGDTILVTTGQGRFTYVVDLVRTSDAPPASIVQAASRLTLVTSDPAIAPSRTLQVSAQLQGDALPASSGTATVADDVPGVGSSGRRVALLLWAQLLLIVTGGVTWASMRLPGRAVWIGAVPVLLAILWNVFENLAVLLPNTL